MSAPPQPGAFVAPPHPRHVSVVASRHTEGRSAFTLYVIIVQYDTNEWTVERRFSEFEELRSRLCEFVHGPELPALPAKTLTRNLDGDFVNQRKIELDRWIQTLGKSEAVRRSNLFQSFIGIDSHRGAAVMDAHLPLEMNAVIDPQFGINHAVYNQIDSVMFTACEDVHMLSKLERKITNLRMPWEKQGGLAPLGCFSCWRVGDGGPPKPKCVVYYGVAATCVCVVPQSRTVYVGLDSGHVMAYNSDDKYESFTMVSDHAAHIARVTSMAYTMRKAAVLSVGNDNHLCVIDNTEKRIKHSLTVGKDLISVGSSSLASVRMDDDYERVFIASSSSAIFIYSIAMLPSQPPLMLHALQGHTAGLRCLNYFRNDGTLFSGGEDFGIGVWNIAPGSSPQEIMRSRLHGMMTGGPQKIITAVCYAPALRQCISGTVDGFLCVWNMRTGRLSYCWKGHTHAVTQLLFDPSQCSLISAAHDGRVKIWKLKTEQQIEEAINKVPTPRKTSRASSTTRPVQPVMSAEPLQTSPPTMSAAEAYANGFGQSSPAALSHTTCTSNGDDSVATSSRASAASNGSETIPAAAIVNPRLDMDSLGAVSPAPSTPSPMPLSPYIPQSTEIIADMNEPSLAIATTDFSALSMADGGVSDATAPVVSSEPEAFDPLGVPLKKSIIADMVEHAPEEPDLF